MTSEKVEQWKEIPGYEQLYEASTFGRIRTHVNKITYTERHGFRHWHQRIMKQKFETRRGKDHKRDARVCLWKDGKEKTFLVSRLVAMTWCDGYSPGLTVNHIDGDPLNNHADNLEWITLSDNIKKGFADGLYHNNQIPCIIVNPDGTSVEFKQLSDANKYLGHNSKYLSNRIRRGQFKTPDGRLIVLKK